jgi:hypothetical protein
MSEEEHAHAKAIDGMVSALIAVIYIGYCFIT